MIGSSPPLRLIAECLRSDSDGFAGGRNGYRDLRLWNETIRVANEHLLVPAMCATLAHDGRLSSIPDEVRSYLEFLHRMNLERNTALRTQALELLRALQFAGVPAMILKGALSLFLPHYPDRGARLFRDIDVLVPARAMSDAAVVLDSIGYIAETKYWPVQHAYAEFARPSDPGAVDLHVEIVDASYILPADEVWRRSREQAEESALFFVPSPTDQIAHNVLHSQVHYLGNFYRGNVELRQVYDFAMLATHHAGRIDWNSIERRFRQHHLLTALESYALAASLLFAVPWPLSRPASAMSRFHFQRCMWQLRFPALKRATVPWGNLRGAFAWHRMNALHRNISRLEIVRQMHHAIQFVSKSDTKRIFARLLKSG